jgi:trans-aconitate methyltransferase
LREGLFVLDVGCGTCADVVDIARRVASSGDVTGVDVSEAMIARLRDERPAWAFPSPSTSIEEEGGAREAPPLQ